MNHNRFQVNSGLALALFSPFPLVWYLMTGDETGLLVAALCGVAGFVVLLMAKERFE
jgi:hypothetical protein